MARDSLREGDFTSLFLRQEPASGFSNRRKQPQTWGPQVAVVKEPVFHRGPRIPN